MDVTHLEVVHLSTPELSAHLSLQESYSIATPIVKYVTEMAIPPRIVPSTLTTFGAPFVINTVMILMGVTSASDASLVTGPVVPNQMAMVPMVLEAVVPVEMVHPAPIPMDPTVEQVLLA
jgi:hypothetical protein